MPTPSLPLQEFTQLLVDWGNGNHVALDQLRASRAPPCRTRSKTHPFASRIPGSTS